MHLRFFCLTAALCGGLACAQLPPPLPYLQSLTPIEGKTVYLKQVRCEAPGKSETLGRIYLLRNPDGSYQTARVEYNEQGKFVLDHGKTSPSVYKYYDKYITQQQPFSLMTMNAIIGLWRLFGMRFMLDNVKYSCQFVAV